MSTLYGDGDSTSLIAEIWVLWMGPAKPSPD